MRISQKKKGRKRAIEVSGALTLDNSLKLKKAILKGLSDGSHLELILNEIDEVDMSFLQIVGAAMKTAEQNNITFSIKAPVPDPVVESMRLSGFLNHSSCSKKGCLWCSVKEQVEGV